MLPRPLLLGHRGLRLPGGPPENTIAAFDCALEAGCDGFEFDVRRSADGQAVICHDPQYKGWEIARAQHSQLEELAVLDDVLSRYSGSAFLDVELKVSGLEAGVIAAIKRHEFARGYLVSSFLPPVLHALRSADSQVPLGVICDSPAQLERWPVLPLQYVIPHFALLTRSLVDEVHGAGKKVIVWTVNTPDEMLRMADWGVDGIVSDNPALLVRTIGTRGC